MKTDLTTGHYWVPPDDVFHDWSLMARMERRQRRIEAARGKGPEARVAAFVLAQERGEGGRPL